MNIVRRMNIALRRFLHNHGNIATEGSPKSGLYSTLIEWLQGFFTVHSTIDNTVHSRPLNGLEHCICTTLMTHIRPGRDSNPVPSFEPQLNRMIHRGRPILYCQQLASPRECVLIIIKLIRTRRAPAEQFTGLTRGLFLAGARVT